MNPNTYDAIYAKLKSVSDSLGETLDSVQIVVTMQDGDETVLVTAGSGSFHARWASVRELVMQWDEYTREEARSAAFIAESSPDEP